MSRRAGAGATAAEDAVVPASPTHSAKRREKAASGFFSFFRWFRKGRGDGDEEEDAQGDADADGEVEDEGAPGGSLPPTPASLRVVRAHSASCGSIDTLFSTATVSSFAFVAPAAYRPFGPALAPEKWIAPGPDTDTYRQRVQERERAREQDRGLTLRRKYRLFGSDSHLRSPDASPRPARANFRSPEASPRTARAHVRSPSSSEVSPRPERGHFRSPSSPETSPRPPRAHPQPQPASGTAATPAAGASLGRKKRRAPSPPASPKAYADLSLPSAWRKGARPEEAADGSAQRPRHRRAASESAKDKRAGAYCHVKGKRRAPPPPSPQPADQTGGSLDRFRPRGSSFGRKKRPAPQPPSPAPAPAPAPSPAPAATASTKRKKDQETQAAAGGPPQGTGSLPPEERERLLCDIAQLRAQAQAQAEAQSRRRSMGSPPSVRSQLFAVDADLPVVANDSLKLERGVLKPSKEAARAVEQPAPTAAAAGGGAAAGATPPAPVSPRPWYKRSLSAKEPKRDLFKSLEKRKKRVEEQEEWAPEAGIPRVPAPAPAPSDGSSVGSSGGGGSRLGFLARLEERRSGGEKRRSQVSLLANISALDREAAEIVQKEQAREQALAAAHDARFYVPAFPAGPPPPLPPGLDLPPPPHSPPTPLDADPGPGPETPKRSSAKELISLFNAIGNVTKVTVNSAFFSREGGEKRFSFSGGGVKTQMATTTTTEEAQRVVVQGACVQQKHITSITTTTTTVVGNHQGEPGSDVVIQEVDEDEQEVNGAAEPAAAGRDFRRRRPLSPSIPTIDEQPEGASPAPTLPLGSSPPGPDALMLAKRLTIWACPRCTLENPRWRITCDACGRWRPADAAIPDSATNANSIFTSFSDLPAFNHTPDTNTDVAPASVSSNPAPALTSSSKTVLTSNSALASNPSTSSNPSTVSNSTTVSNPTPSSNPTPIPITAPTYNSVSVSNHVANPTPSPAASKGIDWERELKRYFPGNGKTPAASKAAETPARPTNNDSKAPEEATKATKPKNDEAVKDSKSAAKLALPSTFIGGRTKADEKRQGASPSLAPAPKTGNAATTASGPAPAASSASTPAATEAPDVDEVRKARLAFFSRDQPEAKTKGKEAVYAGLKLPKDEKEKKKLKEMLKEMKDSLPRRDPKGAVAGGSSAVEPQAHRGAVPKVLDAKAAGVSSNAKAPKVSTSCQTASVVRKVQAAGKGASAVPVTVEELWGAGAGTSAKAGAEGGLLYTSVGKPSAPPCPGGGAAPVPPSRTFELIRARDFATIEATKTAGIAAGAHVYANVPTAASPPPPPQPARRRAHRGNESLASTSAGSDAATATSSSAAASPPPDDDPGADAEAEAEAELEAEVEPEGSACSTSDNSEVERLTAQLTLPKGLAAFKADLQAEARAEGEAGRHRVNTLAVNRLLRRLEAAIVGGQHHQAALLARDLARLRINCCVTRQKPRAPPGPAAITVDMYVEDKVSHQGPIPLQVTPGMTVAELKQKVEQQFEIPVAVQRWILGKMLASDDNKTLEEHNVSTNGCPMFLYLVAPEGEQESDAVTAAPAEPELPEEQVTPASPAAQPPPPPPPEKGGGWYYNHEDDRYSFCEDTESEMATDDEGDDERSDTSPAKLPLHQQKGMPQVPLLNTLNEPELEVREGKDDERENEEEEEDDDEEEEEEEEQGELGERPVLVQPSAVIIHDRPVVIEAPAATAIQKDVTPANVAVAGGSAKHADIGTMKLGWKCPVCTLMNSPTRPGCAACTTERPLKYVVPVEYRANVHEMERIRKEAQGDQELLQAEANAKAPPEQNEHYQELVNLDNTDLVPNTDPFDCSVCFTPCDRHEGVVLRDCLHTFCKPCLVNTVQFNEEAEVKCPFRDNNYACDSVLQEREIKALVPQHVYEQHLAKSVAQAENKIGNTFHCKTPDCRGWCIFEDNVNEFRCPVCRVINCLTCQAIHEGINCKQYQEQVQQQSETNADARRTKEMLEEMVVRGEAMACPTCQVVLMKKWGCDWLRCSMCKTEICWVTRGPRWGPGGKGDTTGGCQCGLNGVKCHPRCNYCH